MARRTVRRRRKADEITIALTSTRAAAYIRVSTEEQAAEGVSLDAQLARITAYAASQNLELVAIFRDEGVSAGSPLASRPEGGRLVSALADHEFAHVIALKLDRCFRHAVDCMQTVEDWTACGVTVHFVDLGGQAIETRSAMGRFFLSIMAACAELELNSIRERTRTALAHKRARGDRLGTTPFGFHTPGPGAPMEPNSVELRIVRRLIALCSADMPFTRVAAVLNEEGHQSKRGGRWHSGTVRAIWLARNRYEGLLESVPARLTDSDSGAHIG